MYHLWYIRRRKIPVVLFSLTLVLPRMSFHGKVFNKETFKHIKRFVHSFSFTRFFSTGFLPSKIFTRHIIYGHPRGSVIKYYSVYFQHTKKLLTHYLHYFPYENDHNLHNLHLYNQYSCNIHFHNLLIIFMLISCLWKTFVHLNVTLQIDAQEFILYTLKDLE